jgi:hypothetical protein
MSERKRWTTGWRLAGAASLAVGLVVLADGGLRGQVPPPPRADYNETWGVVQDMREGKKRVIDPSDKEITKQNKAALERAAKNLAYRLAAPGYNGEPPEKDKKSFVLPEDMTLEYVREFGKAIDQELKVVLEKAGTDIVRINAARMLSLAAKMPCPSLADSLLEIVKDPKQMPAVKLCAFEGLRNLLAQQGPDENQPHVIEDTAKLGEIADTLTEYILTKQEEAAKSPQQADVVRFIRREAIRALAELRMSVVRDRANVIKAKTRPALILMRAALGEDIFVPSLSTSERVEALVGFMNQRPDMTLNTDVAAYGIDLAMLELVRLHQDKDRSIPWKVTGARLSAAAKNLTDNTVNALVARRNPENLKEIAARVDAVAKALEDSGVDAKPDSSGLNAWLSDKPPKTNLLFEDDKESALKGSTKKQ